MRYRLFQSSPQKFDNDDPSKNLGSVTLSQMDDPLLYTIHGRKGKAKAVDDGIIIASLSYFIGVSCSTIQWWSGKGVAFSPQQEDDNINDGLLPGRHLAMCF